MARPVDPNLKLQLLAAAETEFARHGVEAARIDDIVGRAGRSKGAFYQYFVSKEDAFGQIAQALLQRLERIIREPLIADESRPWTRAQFLSRWRARDEAIFDFVWVNRELVRLILAGGYHIDFAALMHTFAARTRDVIVEGLTWGRRHRIYRRDFDVERISVILAGAYDGLAHRLVSERARPNLRKWVAELQRFVLEGIGAN
jgi:AcrR family transcriptional regulator